MAATTECVISTSPIQTVGVLLANKEIMNIHSYAQVPAFYAAN
ncbi:MAG: hypothetical protein WCI05_08660 [Myxococcales bacterium]